MRDSLPDRRGQKRVGTTTHFGAKLGEVNEKVCEVHATDIAGMRTISHAIKLMSNDCGGE